MSEPLGRVDWDDGTVNHAASAEWNGGASRSDPPSEPSPGTPERDSDARYRTIVADPPWPFQWQGGVGGRRRSRTPLSYTTMGYEQIEELAVRHLIADDDATLFLWTTQDALHLGRAALVAFRWGFPQRIGEFIWRKPNFGTGAFPRIGHETCLIYKRGNGSLRPDGPRDVHSVQSWTQPRGRNNGGKTHSAKPDGFYDLVERGYEGPYAELFSRRARFGWEYPIGDQALGGVAA